MAKRLSEDRLAQLRDDLLDGKISNRKLAEKYEISESYVRKLIKERGLLSDRSETIRKTGRAKATKAQATEFAKGAGVDRELTEDETTQYAAEQTAAITLAQQRQVDKLIHIADRHCTALEAYVENVETTADLADKILQDPEVSGQHYKAMMRLLDVGTRAAAIKTTVEAVTRLQEAQRKVYGMDGVGNDPMKEHLDRLARDAEEFRSQPPPPAPTPAHLTELPTE